MHDKFFKIARTNMVKNQILTNNVKNPILIESLLSVEKENFVPESFHDITYSDSDIKISRDRQIIRTFILAKMIEKCEFRKEDSVLVIGCLNGYSLAILSNLVSYVFGIENEKKFVDYANEKLSSMNFHNCSVSLAKNLSEGLKKNAPYDKVFIEGSINYIPQEIIKQVKENGKIFTVLNNENSIGEFISGIKIDSKISFSNLFNTNLKLLKDFIIEGNDYENNL
jgi:protein-L-isoaspartate(D-aspartate) O-methyltransferase